MLVQYCTMHCALLISSSQQESGKFVEQIVFFSISQILRKFFWQISNYWISCIFSGQTRVSSASECTKIKYGRRTNAITTYESMSLACSLLHSSGWQCVNVSYSKPRARTTRSNSSLIRKAGNQSTHSFDTKNRNRKWNNFTYIQQNPPVVDFSSGWVLTCAACARRRCRN